MKTELQKFIINELKEAYIRNSKTIAYHKPNYELLESFRRLLSIYMTPREYINWRKTIEIK